MNASAFTEPYTRTDPGMSTRRKPRPPRIADEKADIEYLIGALNSLCHLVVRDVLGMPGSGTGLAKEFPQLRDAIWTARQASYRASKNRDERALRSKQKAKRKRVPA